LYDNVMGTFGSQLERLLAVGGDSEGGKEEDSKANRFKPVVKFLGPFTLDGGADEHTFVMPQYIGSVKTMVVAGYEGAYGKTDKATPVRKPLMVLATLPRVLGPEEKLKLPVTLFSMEKKIKNVKVSVKAYGPLTVLNDARQVVMNDTDMTVDFDLQVKSELGIGKIEVTATSGNYIATDIIEIDVRNPNPPVTRVLEGFVESGKSWSSQIQPVGVAGSNTAVLEVSTVPPVNLGKRLEYLIQYPHGCIEQTTSSVFPQLYVDLLKQLNDQEQASIQRNVKAGIERLKLFVTNEGGFAYWPGETTPSHWGSSFAGHFLLEAESKGYFVPGDMLTRWKKYQRKQAQAWRKNSQHNEFNHERNTADLMQAYRLYTLAVAGDPEMAAMNRLREQGDVSLIASWMLAAAYARAGQPEAARKVVANLSTNIKPYQEMDNSFGSDVRDKAMVLETMILLDERVKGIVMFKEVAAVLGDPNAWLSTQATSWSLKSVSEFAYGEKNDNLKFTYTYNGKEITASTDKPIAQIELPVAGLKGGSLSVLSNSQATLFIRVISTGLPARGAEQEESSNLNVSVTYTDVDGTPVDPSSLEQGSEFIASVSVQNPGIRGDYKNMALNQIFPSGWEINNLRLDEAESRLNGDKPTYQDIRDDRVYTYFDLRAGESKTFKVLLTASYAGTYYLPAVSCEAMYDRTIYARKKGQVVDVVKPISQ
jgi:alpha-2-macroglobulin